jgi:heme/copper-type cytochrome/quinol oxidase subunit 1
MNIVLLISTATVVACLFATGGVWLCRHLLRGRVASGTHEVLVSALFQSGGTLHAVFLAFLVVMFCSASRFRLAASNGRSAAEDRNIRSPVR